MRQAIVFLAVVISCSWSFAQPTTRPSASPGYHNVLSNLRDSINAKPAPDNEQWLAGPLPDLKTENGILPGAGPETVRPAIKWDIHVRRTRIVKATFRRVNSVDDVMAQWRQRMLGIIEDPEIDTARLAMRDSLIQYQRLGEATVAVSAGTRFYTTATVSKSMVILELLWIDPREPEARDAWAAYVKQHPSGDSR